MGEPGETTIRTTFKQRIGVQFGKRINQNGGLTADQSCEEVEHSSNGERSLNVRRRVHTGDHARSSNHLAGMTHV